MLARGGAALTGVALLDELCGGMPSAGAADVVAGLHLSATAYALAVFALPTLFAIVVEAPLLAWSDRRRALRPRLIAAGLAVMAGALVVEGLAGGAVLLSVGIALYGPASGVACGLAEATLVDAAPERAPKTMARWALLGSIGDLLAPLALALTATTAVGWRAAILGCAALLAMAALLVLAMSRGAVAARDSADEGGDDEPRPPWREIARAPLRSRALVLWLLAAALCTLLDETLVALASVFAHERLHDVAAATATLVALSAGGALGTVLLERLLARRRSPTALAVASSVGCALALVAWLQATSPPLAVALAFALGAFAAPLYPLAKSQAYQALPGHAALVNAAATLFAFVDVAAPLALGAATDRFGVTAALALMIVQPLGVLAIALFTRARTLP